MTFRHAQRELDRSKLNDHGVLHANGSPVYRHWAQEQTLHLAAMYSNPGRFERRKHLFLEFRRHMASLPNVRLYVGELAYGDRPFEVTSANHPDDIQIRTRTELWHKENMLNVVIRSFDPQWEYGAYCDGDFHFNRHDVALETIHQLQHYDWVQMFSQYTDLDYNHRPLRTSPGFAYAYANKLDVHGKPIEGDSGWPGAPGGAWAFRRESFNACGGLLDTCILGSGDHHMALGLVGWERPHPDKQKCGGLYARSIRIWQHRAFEAVNANIGYVEAFASHHFHGPRKNRGYSWRWQILQRHHFDPYMDIFPDSEGIYQLTGNKPRMRDEIRQYFRLRNEDDIRSH